jgi:hypothetical protein
MASYTFKSSMIKNITHDANGLTVEFKNGTRYRYKDVPMAEAVKMAKSLSVGTYYVTNIKGKYSSKKLEKHQA